MTEQPDNPPDPQFAADPQPQADAPQAEPQPQAPLEPRRPSRRNAWLAMGAVLTALLLLMFVPGSDEYDPTAPPPAADAEEPAAGDSLVGKAAPLDFTMKDMHDVDVKLASFKGKVILLNFWATWCGPCKAEIPDLVALQEDYPDDLVVLGISVDDTPDKMQPYADEYKINYPLLVGDGRTDVLNAYGPLWGIPSTFVIDRDGKVTKKHSGMATRAQFEREILPLVWAKASAGDAE